MSGRQPPNNLKGGESPRNIDTRFLYIVNHYIILSTGIRTVKVDDSFFKGYRQIDLDFKEVLTSIYIPFTQKVSKYNKQSYMSIDHINTARNNFRCNEEI